MALSSRRILLNTAVKQWRGIAQWSRTEMATSPRTINLSTPMVKQWNWKCPSIYCNKNIRHLSTDTASIDYDHVGEIGFTDVADLLSTPQRDFLLRNDGQKVPVSSLEGKLVGLYLCENTRTRSPARMHAIKKVYDKAKSRGYDFEIVQISYDPLTKQLDSNPTVEKFRGDSLWLSLPSMDPCFTKLQRIFHRQAKADHDKSWRGDSLFLVHPPQAEAEILFEPSGAEILDEWGIKGYPFTRPSLYKAEYEVQKRKITLQSLFPKGECTLLRPRPGGEGFDVVDALPQLSGKRVLALFANHSFSDYGGNFVSMLKSQYEAQLEANVAEESRFEVVYISTEEEQLEDNVDEESRSEVVCVSTESSRVSTFDFFTKDMPWLVQPFPSDAYGYDLREVFKNGEPHQVVEGSVAVAFNEQGELIAKEDRLDEMKEGDNLQFPFIDQDLEKHIRLEVEAMCNSRARCMYFSDSE